MGIKLTPAERHLWRAAYAAAIVARSPEPLFEARMCVVAVRSHTREGATETMNPIDGEMARAAMCAEG